MNRILTLTAIGILCLACPSAAQTTAPHSYVPPKGFVPDSATAVRIAEAIWIPIYGTEQIAAEHPIVAVLHGDTWTVTGSLPKPAPGSEMAGGVAEAEIAKQDGRILRVSHGK